MKRKIKEVAKLSYTKIDSEDVTLSTYISTENLLSNFGGFTKASTLPKSRISKFEVGDILISNIRPYFKKIWFATFNGGCSNDVLVLKPTSSILKKYLFYALNMEDFINYYVASCKGTKMPRGNKETLLEWHVEVPSIKVQQHIVNTISTLPLISL